MSEPKKLNLNQVGNKYKKDFSKQEKHTLSNGSYIITQKKFKRTAIQQLLVDYITIAEQLKNKDVIESDILRSTLFIHIILTIKHFTNLHDDIPLDVEKMILIYEQLDEYGLIEEIHSLFAPEEINKINQAIDQVAKNSNIIGKQLGELFIKQELDKIVPEDVTEDGE